jgi:NADPH2:quinone reductase
MHATGGPDVLVLESFDLPDELAAHEVRVAVAAAGVNYPDRLVRTGELPVPALPYTLGFEAAGTIEAVGASVTELAVGDRVLVELPRGGGYATRAIAPATAVTVIPGGLDFASALAVFVSGRTALLMLRHARVAPNETVVIPSAVGSVGSIAVRLAAAMGATVIAGVGSEGKRAAALAHGAAAVVVTTGAWADEVRRLTDGRGADVVFQSVVGAESLRALAPFGRLVRFGAENAVHPEPLEAAQVRNLLAQGQSLGGFALMRVPAATRRLALDELATRVATHSLALDVQRFPLAEVRRGHAELDARRTTGKVVFEIGA